MLGLVLLYVGAVLLVNGLTALDRIAPRDAAIMNLFAGTIAVAGSAYMVITGAASGIRNAAFGLLFGLTYLWIAYAILTGQDGRGLGWFSGFVAVTATLVAVDEVRVATSLQSAWLGLCWAAWALLWFAHFCIGALRRDRWRRPVAWLSIAQGALTGWLPGYLLLSGRVALP